MDIITRLRLLLWLLVLGLWAAITFQFLGEDSLELEGRIYWIANPIPRKAASRSAPSPEDASRPRPEAAPSAADTTPRRESPPPAAGGIQASAPERLPAPWDPPGQKLATAAPPGHFIKPIPPKAAGPRLEARKPRRAERALRRHEYLPIEEPATPGGFFRTQTRHFLVFSEGSPAETRFIDTLESLQANLMIDLAAFSPWARDERVSIYLFRNQDSYRKVTGRPAWSGGASSVSRRKIYLYESEELIGILAHELCHIYFDSFFIGGKPNPLWLSEGMATLVQVERGLTSPNWLPENLDILYRGGGFDVSDLMRVENTAGANDDNVRLWYTQAYSVVRFMIRSQWKSSFYRFSSHIREGLPANEALHRAYGMPFNRVKALEYAWRYDLETHRITNLRSRVP